MIKWYSLLIQDLVLAVEKNGFWKDYLSCLFSDKTPPYSVHLAIFVEPFLKYVMNGSKKIESRFSSVRCAPYQSVKKGDVILLKKTGGPIVGLCMVSNAWFYKLDPNSWKEIKKKYEKALCVQDPAFWEGRKQASFATLICIQHVQAISPIIIEKRDRRGWVILRSSSEQLNLQMDGK